MQLLLELKNLTQVIPLNEYLNAVKEFGIDPNDELVYSNIINLVEQAEQNLHENPLARNVATRAGVDLNNSGEKKKIHRMGIDSPRLGLQAYNPEKGDRVLLASGDGIAQVVGFSGDAVSVKNKHGYVIEIPRSSLVAKIIPSPNNPEKDTEIGWIEQG